jgi:hypothetical protein
MSLPDLALQSDALEGFEADDIQEAIDKSGFWLSPSLVDSQTCAQLAGLYEGRGAQFRSTITMARHGFGRGEYKYFARPDRRIGLRSMRP